MVSAKSVSRKGEQPHHDQTYQHPPLEHSSPPAASASSMQPSLVSVFPSPAMLRPICAISFTPHHEHRNQKQEWPAARNTIMAKIILSILTTPSGIIPIIIATTTNHNQPAAAATAAAAAAPPGTVTLPDQQPAPASASASAPPPPPPPPPSLYC